MLEINEFQFESFCNARQTSFAAQLARRARWVHTNSVAEFDEATLVGMMEQAIESALPLGLKKQSLLERFSDLSIILGIGFEETESWAKEIFTSPVKTPETKLREVEASAIFIIRGN